LDGKSFSSKKDFICYVEEKYPEHFDFISELFNDKEYITAFTSGSTGKPKKITILKQFLFNSAKNTLDFFDLPPKTKALLNLSSGFIAGKMMWVRAIIGGWYLDVVQPDNQSICKQLNDNEYDFGAMVPLQVYHNIDKIHKIKKIIIGGGQVSNTFLQKMQNLPNKIYATYGMTETVTHIAVKPLNISANKNFYHRKEQEGSYRLLPYIRIEMDTRACLMITAPQLANDTVITNDLVEIIDAAHFRWLGRYDNIINSGALKFIPEQIESKLQSIIHKNFFVAGIPDEILGEKLVLIVEGQVDEISLINQCKDVLNRYEVPKRIYKMTNFVRTDSGKIMRDKTLQKLIKELNA